MNKAACFKLSYGLYVVTSGQKGRANGQIANSVFQVTSDPPQLAISINKNNYTHSFIEESGKFAVTVLATSAPMTFIGQFGFRDGRKYDKFQGVNCLTAVTGVPIVTDNGLAYFECLVKNNLACGTHTIFLGEIVGMEILGEGEPMTYAYYHLVKGGKSPKTAPTFIESSPKQA
jgi:flavin reductase (DIM6/NTAB) family NADH-FMN oxidoreductase RutF